jgi:hypothetical protein
VLNFTMPYATGDLKPQPHRNRFVTDLADLPERCARA